MAILQALTGASSIERVSCEGLVARVTFITLLTDSESDFSKESTPSEGTVSSVPQMRTLSNVLRRLGSILDRKGQVGYA